ncbi:hypothetical protein K8I61_03400 [bacterium]|nr:hypothetical protein [bacterium]
MHRPRLYILSIVVALAVALGTACGSRDASSKHELVPFESDIKLSQADQRFLLDAARKGLSGEAIPALPAGVTGIDAGGAVVEVFLPPNEPAIAVVAQRPFDKAFAEAVKQAKAHKNFGKIGASLADARVKVGLISEIKELDYPRKAKGEKIFRQIARQVEDGIHGFIYVSKEGKTAFQIPEMVHYEGWAMKGETRYMGRRLVGRQLPYVVREAAGTTKGWKEGEILAFRQYTFIEDAADRKNPVEVFRTKNMLPPLTTETVRAGAIANATYLAKAVNDEGRFNYIYYPELDKYDRGYSIVRHAGSVYGLFEAYNHFGDDAYFDAGRRSMDYLLRLAEEPAEAPEIAIIKERGRSVLGTNALAAMAYSAMPEDRMTDRDKEMRNKLGESILYYRMPQKGLFYTSFTQAYKKNPPREQARYYPGESMLALVKLYERTGDKKWYEAAKDLAPGQKELWMNAGHASVGDYCWVGQAFARMARIEPDAALANEYREIGYSHADAVIKHQYTADAAWKDYEGGADNSRPPRTTPTSARGESLAENYLTAKHFGDTETQKKYGAALLKAIHFCVQNQWSPQNSWFLPYPEKAEGGIRGSLIANDIRIDYNQHLLSTQIMALEAPADLAKLGVTW